MKRSSDELEEGEEIEDECIQDFNGDDWDDSALIEAWDLAKNEYLKHHGLEQDRTSSVKKQKTKECDPIKDQTPILDDAQDKATLKENSALLNAQVKNAFAVQQDQENQNPLEEADKQGDFESSQGDQKDFQEPISPDQLNALMAWYWAGYYTAKLSK